jgi:hypothetical protein
LLSLSGTAVLNVITASGTGGTGALEYSIDGQNFQVSNVFASLANGTYTIVVRDANGCTASSSFAIDVPALVLAASQTQTILCNGNLTGEITTSATGGVPPYQYSLNSGAYQNNNVFSGLGAGTYTVTIKDAAGTETQSSTSISEPAAIVPTVNTVYNSITVNATGGTGTLQYSIDGQNYQLMGLFTGLANGDYTVVVRDNVFCTVSVQITINVAPLDLAPAQTQTISCNGSQTGQITAMGSGGIPPYEFSLNGGAYQPGNVFSNLGAGTYSISIKDSQGADTTKTVVVTQPDPLNVAVALIGSDATVVSTGGVQPYAYTLNGAPATDFTNLAQGNYTLVVTDANGCTNSTQFTVLTNTLNVQAIATVKTVKCPGDANGATQICINGGYPPIAIQFSPAGTLSPDSGGCAINYLLHDLAAGDYSVVVSDAYGFTRTLSFSINEPVVINATGSSLADSIVVTATGGTGALHYSIDGGATYQSSPVFKHLQNGTYQVLVKDDNGCTAMTADIVVNTVAVVEPGQAWGLTVSPNPGPGRFLLNMQQAPATLQVGVFDAAGRRLNQWNFEPVNGSFATELDLRNLPQGIYFLRLTDGKNTGGVRLCVVR